MNREDFTSVTAKMLTRYLKKEKDYGDTYERSFHRYAQGDKDDAYCYAHYLIGMKAADLRRITIEEPDETGLIKKTLLDIANYAVMFYQELEKLEEDGKE